MTINGIIWLENIVEKLLIKHNVTPEEIIEVLNNNPKFKFVEKGFRENEDVYAALGQTLSGRYLIIFFVYKKSKEIIIISARDMAKKEKKYYEKK